MDYYDSTVAYYDNQIYNNNQRISNCNQKIKQLEDDIENLKKVKIKIASVDSAVAKAADGTSKKIANLPSLIFNSSSVLNINYFSNFLDVVNGSEHTKAKNGLNNANSKIDVKIRELKCEIENLRNEIRQCNSNITSLSWQRSSYIESATTPKAEADCTSKS